MFCCLNLTVNFSAETNWKVVIYREMWYEYMVLLHKLGFFVLYKRIKSKSVLMFKSISSRISNIVLD